VQLVCRSALHILRLLELLACSQVTSGDYQVPYASPCMMTKAPSRLMQAILIKDCLAEGVLISQSALDDSSEVCQERLKSLP
jgi:hypothetical protein